MISVYQAQQAIISSVTSSAECTVSLVDSLGYVIAKDIECPIDVPPFRQSGVDGYAFRFDDFKNGETIHIIGESSAGASYREQLDHNQTVRIFTGAEVPNMADTVVMQEKVTIEGDFLTIQDEKIVRGANVRPKGSHISIGEIAVTQGCVINAGTIGFLASMGIGEICVHSKPRIAIIITGNELRQSGEQLRTGQIYESNSVCLSAALHEIGITDVSIFYASDSESSIRAAFHAAVRNADILLFTGGISVGDYDFVGKVLRNENVCEVFYKVKQRPGKPLFYGVRDDKYIFGLPGNPASVLTCFYEYVLPALRTMMGYFNPFLQSLQLPLSQSLSSIKGLTFFLKATTDYVSVTPLGGQPSYMMRSFTEANCFIVVPEAIEQLDAGQIVEVHLLP
jgi:molybdopterin molybdotransferase